MQKENITQPIAIDLGLPSGTLWSDRNLGAESVTEYGDYYMWGSTEPCTDKPCDWSHAPFNGGFQRHNLDMFETFRTEAFSNGILSDQYDAAHVQLGGNWRIPTKGQFKELLDCTKSEWVVLNGVNGRRFTSKTNGNSIFIPAAGSRNGSSIYVVGSGARLWSSTLGSGNPYGAYGLYFYSGFVVWNRNYRSFGLSVRPVCQ